MVKAIPAKAAVPYIRRVIEDEYVQDQLRSALGGAGAAWRRARKQGTQAADDKRVRRNLRQATTAMRKATAALRPPEPEPKHRGRKLAVLTLAIGATVVVTLKLQKHQSQSAASPQPAAASEGGFAGPGRAGYEEPAPPPTRSAA
jgi:hypothetical protein